MGIALHRPVEVVVLTCGRGAARRKTIESEHLTETELNRIESEAKAHFCPSVQKRILALVRDIRHYQCEAGNVAKDDTPESCEQMARDYKGPPMSSKGLRHG